MYKGKLNTHLRIAKKKKKEFLLWQQLYLLAVWWVDIAINIIQKKQAVRSQDWSKEHGKVMLVNFPWLW